MPDAATAAAGAAARENPGRAVWQANVAVNLRVRHFKIFLFIVLCDKTAQTNHAKVHNTATGMQKATLLEETTTEIKTKIKKTSYTTQYVQHINDFKCCILMQDHCLRFRKYMCAKRLIG